MNNKKVLVPILIVVSTVSVLTAAVFGYLYLTNDVENERTEAEHEDNNGDRSTEDSNRSNVEDESESGDSNNTGDGDENENYISQRYECSAYASLDQEKEGYMVIVYPESVELKESENPNADCDLTLKYKGAQMTIAYTVGEAYPRNLDKDYVTIKEEDGITLVRNPLRLVEEGDTGNERYYTRYIELLDESECQPNELFGDLRPPCGLRANPFVTNSGLFSLEVPKDTPASEREDIVEVFDEVARRSYGGKL